MKITILATAAIAVSITAWIFFEKPPHSWVNYHFENTTGAQLKRDLPGYHGPGGVKYAWSFVHEGTWKRHVLFVFTNTDLPSDEDSVSEIWLHTMLKIPLYGERRLSAEKVWPSD